MKCFFSYKRGSCFVRLFSLPANVNAPTVFLFFLFNLKNNNETLLYIIYNILICEATTHGNGMV